MIEVVWKVAGVKKLSLPCDLYRLWNFLTFNFLVDLKLTNVLNDRSILCTTLLHWSLSTIAGKLKCKIKIWIQMPRITIDDCRWGRSKKIALAGWAWPTLSLSWQWPTRSIENKTFKKLLTVKQLLKKVFFALKWRLLRRNLNTQQLGYWATKGQLCWATSFI